MSTSDDIKDTLNDIYGRADWKRISKKKLNSQYELREFREPASGVIISAFTHVESQHTQLYNGSKLIFGIAQNEDELIIRIAEPFYEQAGESNEGLEKILPFIGKTLPSYLRYIEDGEAICDAGLHSRDQLVADMVNGGFTFDLTLANSLNEDYGGPVYSSASLGQLIAEAMTDDDVDAGLTKYEREILASDKVIFGVFDEASGGQSTDGICVSFGTPEQFARDGHIMDSHLEFVLEEKGFKIPAYLSEDAENMFSVWEDGMDYAHRKPLTINKQQVIVDLTAAGFVFSQAMDDYLNQ